MKKFKKGDPAKHKREGIEQRLGRGSLGVISCKNFVKKFYKGSCVKHQLEGLRHYRKARSRFEVVKCK